MVIRMSTPPPSKLAISNYAANQMRAGNLENARRAAVDERRGLEKREELNELGLVIPSKNSRNYEPNVNKSGVLMAPGYNYKQQAKVNKARAWAKYGANRNLETRRRAAAKKLGARNLRSAFNAVAGVGAEPEANSNNGTRRTLFRKQKKSRKTRKN